MDPFGSAGGIGFKERAYPQYEQKEAPNSYGSPQLGQSGKRTSLLILNCCV